MVLSSSSSSRSSSSSSPCKVMLMMATMTLVPKSRRHMAAVLLIGIVAVIWRTAVTTNMSSRVGGRAGVSRNNQYATADTTTTTTTRRRRQQQQQQYEQLSTIQQRREQPQNTNFNFIMPNDDLCAKQQQQLQRGQQRAIDSSSALPAKQQRRATTITKPLIVASYPSSAAGWESFRTLVRAMVLANNNGGGDDDGTTISSSNKGLKQCRERASLVCETLQPVLGGPVPPTQLRKQFHPTAFVLVRNPAAAILMRWKQRSQKKQRRKRQQLNNNNASSTTDLVISMNAVMNAWREWIAINEARLREEIQLWKRVILDWALSSPFDIQYISAEALEQQQQQQQQQQPSDEVGPQTALRIRNELASAGVTELIPEDQVPCLWYELVRKNHTAGGSHSTNNASANDKSSNMATSLREHQEGFVALLLGAIHELRQELRNAKHEDLMVILDQYQTEIQTWAVDAGLKVTTERIGSSSSVSPSSSRASLPLVREEQQPLAREAMEDEQEGASPECSRMPPAEMTASKPIIVPSFPGSGSECLRHLFESMTGLKGAIWLGRNCVSGRVVTCKTHDPVIGNPVPQELNPKYHTTIILLVRNPATALASRFNVKWEQKNGYKDHTHVGPEEEWRRWRDREFVRQIRSWEKMIWEWENVSPYNVEYVSMESMVDPIEGPTVVMPALRRELLRANVTTVATEADLECLWKLVVQKKALGKRPGHTYTPAYTPTQHAQLLHELSKFQSAWKNKKKKKEQPNKEEGEGESEQNHDQHPLVSILDRYMDDIRNKVPIEGKQQPKA